MTAIIVLKMVSILYFIGAIRLRVWRVSVSTFVIIATAFIIAMLNTIEICREYWVNLHIGIIISVLTFLMIRVVWQKYETQHKDLIDNCRDCINRKGI